MMGALRHAAGYAQSRARHASLLSGAGWAALLRESDVTAIAAHLGEGPYGPDLPAAPADLERRLKAALAAEVDALAALQWGEPKRLLTAYGRRFELENLKTLLRARHHGIPPERCEAVLVPLPRTVLDWEALLQAPSMQSVAELLAVTPYARPIRTVLDQHGEAPPFPFEVALDLAFFQTLVRRILRLQGADGRWARRFVGSWVAVENLSWAFRYRRLAGLTPEETVNYTLHRAFGAGLDAVRRVATGATVAEEAARLGFSIDPTVPEDEALVALERAARRQRTEAASRLFERAPFGLAAPLALLTLREAEVQDLVTVLEARTAGLGDNALADRLLSPASRLEA